MENKKLSLSELNELYKNNPNEYKNLYEEKPKCFRELTLTEKNELYKNNEEMFKYYSQNPTELITMKTNDIKLEQSTIINELKDLQKEINQMKSNIYKGYPSELEWEKKLDEMVEESLKDLFGGY